jgi:UDP-N-acetylglucosamine--N-acetylmuramyl-(pentapeptide) pyrophosphoryl-undecaprenol N-acetylglucosamine transferase
VIQIAGHRDYPAAKQRFDAAGRPADFTLLEYEPDLGDTLAACDLVLARAGGSLFELAAAGRPALLVPYPHATADHQRANAAWMADAGAAVVIEDSELRPSRLALAVDELFEDQSRLERMAAAARALARPDAARRIAEQVLEAAR